MNKKALEKSIAYLESWLDYRSKNSETPGTVVLIAEKNKVIFQHAYGLANIEKEEAMTTNHLFRIASHSKMFTAVAILQLAEAEKLKIDDYAVKYLSWLSDHKDRRWQKVTIRQLLSHSAGIIRDGLAADYWQLTENFPNIAQLKKDILETDLVVDSNIQMKYSNFGFAILGMIIEAVSGENYQNHVTKKIIKPLKLGNTGPEINLEIKRNLVTGYSRRDIIKTRKPIDNIFTHALAPATGFYSCATDLSIFINALRVGSGKLLTDESKREMQRTHWQVHNSNFREEYGFGLEINYYDNHRLWGHSGGFPGQLTSSYFDTETDLTVIVLTNCLGSDITDISDNIFGVVNYFQDNFSPTGKNNLRRFEGRFINLWGVSDIISLGNKLIATFPGWRPFSSPEELSFVDNNSLKISKTNGYYSAGELVHYNFDKSGGVESINYCGLLMWPENIWVEKQSKITTISIPK